MGLAKKAIYRIRKKLVKKIYIDNYYFEQDQLVFSLKLVNFLYIKNSYASIEYEGKKSHALVERKMRNLLIKVPNTMIDKIKDKANINLYINDEKMLISQTKNFKRLKDDIIIRKKYFRPSINKNIILTHRFSEYQFKQEGIHAQVENVGYEKVVLRMENESVKKVSVNHIQCFAIRGSKIFGVETLYNRKTNTLEVENFKLFPSGLWRLYINLEGYLHPIKLNSEKVIQFETNNHIVKIMNKNSNCYFRFKSRVLDADEIKISKTSTDFVELKILNFPEELKEAELSLLIRDTVSNLEADFLAEIKDDELVVYIRIDYLLESFSRKSFFIKKGEQQSKRYQFNLNKTALTGDEVEFKKNQYGEILTMNFYKRRDKSLGLKTQRPRISKHINNVEEFRLKGYLAPLEGFDNVKAYLGLQERETEELSELLITPGEFEIDVRDYDLLRLQTKQKTIIDFFVFIKNDKEEIIRKEKIKYIHANYKKDNYFSNKIIEENHKEHHYLLTVTPFKNLKIETFTIPSGIEIPKEVEMKRFG